VRRKWDVFGRTWEHLRGLWLVLVLIAAPVVSWAQTPLTLHGDAVEGDNGHDVTMVFRTTGFWQITQGMGTIQWDPAVADYVQAGDFGIPEINNATFSRIPEGMLIFDWDANNALGTTVPDGTILFSLTFDLRGMPGQSTSVAFTNAWTELHFESAENINLPFTSVSGTISVVPEPSAAALVAAGLVALALAAVRKARGRASSEDVESVDDESARG